MLIPSHLSAQNPWPGLRPFTEADRKFFFGREGEASNLVALIQRESVVVLYGQSGLGKTSLIQAGIFPQLKLLDFLPVRVRFDLGQGARPLAQQIKLALAAELDAAQISAPRPEAVESLWEYFHRSDIDFWGPRNRLYIPVIFLDQFEELFTLGQRDAEASGRVTQFFEELESLLEHRPPDAFLKHLEVHPDLAQRYDRDRAAVKFVITLREDFLAYLDPYRKRIPSLLANRARLERMKGAKALEVVQRAGRELVEPDVARQIVDFVSTSKQSLLVRDLEERDVEPALLSVVCDELNRRRIELGQSMITANLLTVEREEIIRKFYERSFDDIDPQVRDWVEDELLTANGHRSPAALEDALRLGLPGADLDRLVNRRVLHREERSGVIWLELTHDLLTDPASESRQVREQRHQAELARNQQEEYRRELKKSRALAGVFGILLMGVVIALVYAVRSRHLASQRESEREGIYRSAADMAERLSYGIGSTSWVPFATVEQTIQDSEQSYKDLNAHAANSRDLERDVQLRQARFLAGAADALYQAGHFEEGLELSSNALALLQGIATPASADDRMKLARAEIQYELGSGSLATGKFDLAASDFSDALNLVASVSNADSSQEAARVFILSQIGLGQVSSDRFTVQESLDHFQKALDRANRTQGDPSETAFWGVQTFLALGWNQWIPAQSQTWYEKAEAQLKRVPATDADNPRWKALSGELAYDQGYDALNLGLDDSAKSYFEQASATFGDLSNRDPQNWQWELMQARSSDGLARAYIGLKEWDLSENLLTQADGQASNLNEEQPGWVDAGLLRGSTMQYSAEIPALRLLESWNRPQAAREEMMSTEAPTYVHELDTSYNLFSEAAKILKTIQPSDRGSLQLAQIDVDQGLVRYLESAFDDQSRAQKWETEALAAYTQGRDLLLQIAPSSHPSPDFLSQEGEAYGYLSEVQLDLKDEKDAIANRKRAITTYQELVASAPTADNHKSLSGEFQSLGDIYLSEKAYAQALSQYQQAITEIDAAIARAALETHPQGAPCLPYCGQKSEIYSKLSQLALARGDLRGALDNLNEALEIPLQALQDDYTNMTYRGDVNDYRATLEKIRDALQNPDSPAPYKGLNPEQSKAYLAQTNALLQKIPSSMPPSPSGVWMLPPLVSGAWRTLDPGGDDFKTAAQKMFAVHPDLRYQLRGIRTLTLDFYGDAHLYEAEVSASGGPRGTFSYVQRDKDWVALDGTSSPIEKLNSKSPPHLDTPERAVAYLRFYMGAIQSTPHGDTNNPDLVDFESPDGGTYLVVDQGADLPWLESATAQQRTDAASKIKPLWVTTTPDHEWQALGTVEHDGTLFGATFRLSRTGIVDPAQAGRLASGVPVWLEFFNADGLRVQGTQEDALLDAMKRNPDDESAVLALVDIEAGRNENEKAESLLIDFVTNNPDTVRDGPEAFRKDESLFVDFLKRNPSNEPALFALVGIYWDAREYDKEETLLLGFLKQNPDSVPALEYLVGFYESTQENDKAESLLLGFMKQHPDSVPAFNSLLDFYRVGGQIDKEKGLLADFLKRNPGDEDALENLLDLYADDKEYQKAQTVLTDILKQDPSNRTALRNLGLTFFNENLWADAVSAQQKWVSYLQSETGDDPYRKDILVSAYAGLSWFQLFTRDFTGALASANAGAKLDSANLLIAADRANALLFLGRAQEADSIYLANRGKSMGGDPPITWQDDILGYFDLLEKAGITNPEIPRLRKLLSPQR